MPNPFKSNFVRIAENTAKYYLELNGKYADRFEDESSMLATAGVLDAQNYIFTDKPQIDIETLIGLAKDSVSGVNEIAKNIRTYAFGSTMNQFKKRKISAGTRSDVGRDCRDTFASLKKTCKKLGISFWEYLNDRVAKTNKIPRLSFLVQQAIAANT